MLLARETKIKQALSLEVIRQFCQNTPMFETTQPSKPSPLSLPNYFLKYFLPGILLILCAFWAGTAPQMILALAGFLSFFTVGVSLIAEGIKKRRSAKKAPPEEGA